MTQVGERLPLRLATPGVIRPRARPTAPNLDVRQARALLARRAECTEYLARSARTFVCCQPRCNCQPSRERRLVRDEGRRCQGGRDSDYDESTHRGNFLRPGSVIHPC